MRILVYILEAARRTDVYTIQDIIEGEERDESKIPLEVDAVTKITESTTARRRVLIIIYYRYTRAG